MIGPLPPSPEDRILKAGFLDYPNYRYVIWQEGRFWYWRVEQNRLDDQPWNYHAVTLDVRSFLGKRWAIRRACGEIAYREAQDEEAVERRQQVSETTEVGKCRP